MRQADLRKLATSLCVSSRGKRQTNELLRAACKRALEGQAGLAPFFRADGPPPSGIAPSVAKLESATRPVTAAAAPSAATARGAPEPVARIWCEGATR